MPVSLLLVEGTLDREILASVFAGNPAIDPHSTSKSALAPRVRDKRRDGITACYIRDRDFDFLPPTDITQPTIDNIFNGVTLGWRWCRHELENYLIDPGIIQATFGWDRTIFENELVNSAKNIKYYQAAHWTVGEARQVLPPTRDFPTKPSECSGHDFRLPADLTEVGAIAWVQTQSTTFLANVQTSLAPTILNNTFTNHLARFTDTFLSDVTNVLNWFSGKDLLASLITWLQMTYRIHPTQLCERVRDWIMLNPDQTLILLPEWDAFRNLVRTHP
jgi:hypothetical protein